MSMFHATRGLHAALAVLLACGVGAATAQVVNLGAPAAATATQARPAPSAAPSASPQGTAGPQDLLALQRSGAAASPTAYPVPAAVAQKTYRRYVDSFGHPLPEWHRPSVGAGRSTAGSSGH